VLEPATEAVIAVVSVIYLVIALGYPADAGGVPAIIAAIAAAVALFQLAARGIGALRHRTGPPTEPMETAPAVMDAALVTVPARRDSGAGRETLTEHDAVREPGPPETTPRGSGGPAAEQPARGRRSRRTTRELVALGWIWAAVGASYLFGFEVGVPLVAAAYCLTSVEWRRRWQRLTYAAVVTGTCFGIAYAFTSLFSLTFSGVWS
jgi:hypothetical protein